MVGQEPQVRVQEPGGASTAADLALLPAVRREDGVQLLAQVRNVALEDPRHVRPSFILGRLHPIQLVAVVPQLRSLPVLLHQAYRQVARPVDFAHRAVSLAHNVKVDNARRSDHTEPTSVER